MKLEKALEILKKEKEFTKLNLENGYSSVHMRSFVEAVDVVLGYCTGNGYKLNDLENAGVNPVVFILRVIIDELEDLFQPNVDIETGEPCDNWVVDMQNEDLKKHIDIIASVADRFGIDVKE